MCDICVYCCPIGVRPNLTLLVELTWDLTTDKHARGFVELELITRISIVYLSEEDSHPMESS